MMTVSAMTTVNPFMHATGMANTSDGSGNSNGQSSDITANDFLTLLVTEMQNQDPTAQTDPNEYINQLVQVNSLEQLIDINQNLSSALGNTQASGVAAPGTPANAAHSPGIMSGVSGQSVAGSSICATTQPIAALKYPIATTPGNLEIPAPMPSAQRIAHALSGPR
jgi:flagellar basal-body rod modification protein FlgD